MSSSAKRVAVIGGGPAGLIAAEILSAAGRPVTIYERMPSLGRKLLMAGRGGLNLTHSEPLDAFLARYGPAAEMAVEIASITLIGENRAQVRLRKRLTSPQGAQDGSFTATLMFAFQPERTRSIDDVWQNPFGFTVTQYAIRSDRSE